MAKKLYILDTNVLISDPDAVNAFDDNTVIIPTEVIEELDNQKNEPGDKGFNVRRAIRNIHALQSNVKVFLSETVENFVSMEKSFPYLRTGIFLMRTK